MSKKCCVCLATCISLKDPFTVLKNGLTLVEAILLTKVSTQEAITFSWELTTTPVEVPGMKPTASITIDSTKVDKEKYPDVKQEYRFQLQEIESLNK